MHGNAEYQCKSVKSVGTKTPTDSTDRHGYAEYQCKSVKSVGTKTSTDGTNKHGYAEYIFSYSLRSRNLNYPNYKNMTLGLDS